MLVLFGFYIRGRSDLYLYGLFFSHLYFRHTPPNHSLYQFYPVVDGSPITNDQLTVGLHHSCVIAV